MKLRGLLVYMFFLLYATFCRSSDDNNCDISIKTIIILNLHTLLFL